MASITVTTTANQDLILAWLASHADPPVADGPTYLQQRVTEVLQNYVRQYREAHTPATPDQMHAAFLAATPAQQNAILTALGLGTMQP